MYLICANILQHLPVPVRYTHQSMPIIETLLLDLRGTVPTVGTIQVVLEFSYRQKSLSTVMAHNFD